MISVKHLMKEFPLGKGPSLFHHIIYRNKLPTFRALEDVSFHICPGEVVGIIGLNGAGKSTLLKILSGVSQPSYGEVMVNGTCVAILELATGFNPNLTGRENINRRLILQGYHNGYIESVEQDIIDFSELCEFIDEKIRTYSLGMAARLAFSIAVFMDAEIIIIDEILVVGDEYFQGKSFRKIKEICNSGRTVMIASHSINYVERLCNRAIWLEKGKIVMEGPAHKVGMEYLAQNSTYYEGNIKKEYAIIKHVQVIADCNYLFVQITIHRLMSTPNLHIQIAIHDNCLGILSQLLNTALDGAPPIPDGLGPIKVNLRVRLNSGLKSGLIGVVLVRGSGNIPESIIEDSWGWDNGKQIYFSSSQGEQNHGYIGIPMSWNRCT